MKFDRIVLFVLGNGTGDVKISAQALQSEILNRISYTCDKGSVFGACFALFDGKKFSTTIDEAVTSVQADDRLITYGIAADAINCVFVMNNSLNAAQWDYCINATRQAMGNIANKVNYYAIVQRDSMFASGTDKTLLASALANANMAVYCFQQKTEKGNIISSETDERQLMAYYALLAGAGELHVERGIYTGSFNKLSLTVEDFDRIRNYYVVRGLTENSIRETVTDDALFGAFFGSWAGSGLNETASYELLRQCMRLKLTEFFPGPEELAILANKDDAIASDNVQRFIEINFKNKQRFGKFADKIIKGMTVNAGRPGIVRSWEISMESMLDSNPSYYSEDICDYIIDRLIPWIRKNAAAIEKTAKNAMDAVPSVVGGKEFIGPAISTAQQCMEHYKDFVAADVLRVIADKLLEKAIRIREEVRNNVVLFEKRKWLLDDADLSDFNHYARNIIEHIESYCRTNNLPHSAMASANEYFGENVEASWDDLVASQNSRIQNQFRGTADLIGQLRNDDAAQFRREIHDLLQDRGSRLNFGGSPVSSAAGTPRTIYVIPNDIGVGINDKDFPEATLGNCKKIEVPGFDNVLQFRITRLTSSTSQHPIDSPDYRKDIFEQLPTSARYVKPTAARPTRSGTDNDGFEEEKGPTILSANTMATASFDNMTNRLKIMLPVGVTGAITCTLEGYTDSGSIHQPEKKYIMAGATRNISVPISGFFGRCRVRIVKSEGNEQILDMEFDGPRLQASECRHSRPVFGKKKDMSAMGKEFVVEHHIFKLTDRDDADLEACINPTGASNDDAFRYPIGGGREWHVWVGESFADSMTIEACDREGIRQLNCD